MRRFVALLIVVCLMVFCSVLSRALCAPTSQIKTATESDQFMKVQLNKPVEMQRTQTADSGLVKVTKEAAEYGLKDATINGNVQYEPTQGGATRARVTWHSVTMQRGNKEVTAPIDGDLYSQFATADKTVDAGTVLTVRGDFSALSKAITALKEREEDQTRKDAREDAKAVQLSPQDGGAGAYTGDGYSPSSSSAPKSSDSPSTGETKITFFEECQDFVSEGDLSVYEQRKEVVKGESGVIYSTSSCSNSGRVFPIKATAGNCTTQIDFEAKRAIQMEQWYYAKDGTDIPIGLCRESTTAYALYESRNGCTVMLDPTGRFAIPEYRMAYDINGTTFYASECAAKDGNPIPLLEDVCSPEYEHDMFNKVTYLRTRRFYNLDGQKVYVDGCSRNLEKSYVHQFEETGWIMDDTKLRGGLKVDRVITVDGQRIVVAAGEVIQYVPYSIQSVQPKQLALVTSQSFTAPSTGKYRVVLIAGGAPGRAEPFAQQWYAGFGCYSGGAAGALVDAMVDLQGRETIPVQIGKSGQDTFFGSYLSAKSGAGAKGGAGIAYEYGGCKGGTGATGYTSYNGQALPVQDGFLAATAGPETIPSGSSTYDFCKQYREGACGGAPGLGYGAGGGGGLRIPLQNPIDSAGAGASGYALIQWSERTYMRPDGSTYDPAAGQ